jgi:hypothetical protein
MHTTCDLDARFTTNKSPAHQNLPKEPNLSIHVRSMLKARTV